MFIKVGVSELEPSTLVAGRLVLAALTLGYGLVVVLLAHHLADRVRANPMVATMLNRVAGALLIGFGLKLALFK